MINNSEFTHGFKTGYICRCLFLNPKHEIDPKIICDKLNISRENLRDILYKNIEYVYNEFDSLYGVIEYDRLNDLYKLKI